MRYCSYEDVPLCYWPPATGFSATGTVEATSLHAAEAAVRTMLLRAANGIIVDTPCGSFTLHINLDTHVTFDTTLDTSDEEEPRLRIVR